MDIHAWIAIATLVMAMALFISKLIPVVLAVTGTVSPAEAALRGFGNNAGTLWERSSCFRPASKKVVSQH